MIEDASTEFRDTERFRVVDRLGQGAMGVVYRAFDAERGTMVALKTLARAAPTLIYRMKREFRALADVHHPNLVGLHELFAEGDRVFFTMDLVEGKSFLAHVRGQQELAFEDTVWSNVGESGGSEAVIVRRSLPSPPSRREEIDRLRAALRELAEGVDALHNAGKLHRDIKPSNVLVTAEGRVKILDFGLVSDQRKGPIESTREATILGTPAYMAPEQAAGKKARPASDWYAVGVMLYEALTGQIPFTGTLWQVLLEKQTRDPEPPRQVARDVPLDLDELCMALLRRNPDDRPNGAEVLRRLGGTLTLSVPPLESSRFVGRDRELAVLQEQLGEAENTARLVLVHGRSGMGKSALLARFADELGSDVLYLTGRCYERESMPYKAFDSLVDGLSHHLARLPSDEVRAILPEGAGEIARLFPVLRGVPGMPEPRRDEGELDRHELLHRAYDALRDLFRRIAARSPLVLMVDDLQWGDADSARLLEALLASPGAPPMLVLGAYRTEEAKNSALLEQAAPLAAEIVALGPLDSAEAEALALALLPSNDAGSLERAKAIAREADGIPFFVGELSRYAREAAPIREVTLASVVTARIERLPAGARKLLAVIAVAGRPLPQRVALEAAGAEDGQTLLRNLRAASLIRTEGAHGASLVETYHDRIRHAAAATLEANELAACHARLAVALEAVGADAELLVLHYRGAGDLPRASQYALAAAKEAERALAFHRAAELYRLLLDLERTRGSGSVGRLQIRLGMALVECGRGPEAAAAFLEAAKSEPVETALDLRRRAAEQLLISGHVDEGLRVLDQVLRAVGFALQESPQRALVSFLARAATLRIRGTSFVEKPESAIDRQELVRIDVCFSAASGLTFTDAIRAADFQARHLLLALRAGEPARVALGLANYAAHLASEGGPMRERVEELVKTARAIATRVDHGRALGRARMAAGTAAFFQGRFVDALGELDVAERVLRERCTGVAWELDGTELWARLSLITMGRFRELAKRSAVELRDAMARGDRFAETWIGASAAVYEKLAEDDPKAARARIAAAVSRWNPRSFLAIHYLALWHEVLCDLYEGDGARALARLEERWPAVTSSLLLRIQICRVVLIGLRAAAAIVASRNDGRLLSAAERDVAILEREKMPYADATALALRAGIADGRGDRARRDDLFRRASIAAERVAMRALAASCRLRLGERERELAKDYFEQEGLREPARWTNAYAPIVVTS